MLRTVGWLRMAGCDRVVVPVGGDDEQAGAGRFYQRFGWNMISRQSNGWEQKRK